MQYLKYLDDIMDILHYVAGLTYPVTQEHHIKPSYVACQVCHRNINDHVEKCVVKKAQDLLESVFMPTIF